LPVSVDLAEHDLIGHDSSGEMHITGSDQLLPDAQLV
jgi:hypothetical protein